MRLWVLGSEFTKLLSFLKQQISFSSNLASIFRVTRHNSSVYNFLAKILYTFKKKRILSKYIWWNFTWAVESLKFYTLMGSFGPNHVQFQLKNTEEFSLMTLKSNAKFKEKLTCSFRDDIRSLLNFHCTTQKSENFTLTGSVCPNYKGLR